MKKSEWIDRLIIENKSQLDNIRRGRTELDMSYEESNNCFTFSKDMINNIIKNNKEEMIYKEFAKKNNYNSLGVIHFLIFLPHRNIVFMKMIKAFHFI